VVELRRATHAISTAASAAARHRGHSARRHLHPQDLETAEVRHKQRAAVRADGDAAWVVREWKILFH